MQALLFVGLKIETGMAAGVWVYPGLAKLARPDMSWLNASGTRHVLRC